MKKFPNILFGIIFGVLIVGSIQSVSADHSLGDKGIFKDESNVHITDSIDSKWLLHVQIIVQDQEGRLISVTEGVHGSYIPHKVSDYIFDEYLGEKEVVTFDKIKYEKIRYIQTDDVNSYTGFFHSAETDFNSQWKLEFCFKTNEHGNEQGISCIPVFQVTTAHVQLGEDSVFTQTWTILREL